MLNLTMSVMGLYNYDPSIFDNMCVPTQIDKNLLIPGILAESAELETLYPNAVVLKSMIGTWSAQMVDSWQRACDAFLSDYNPIHNFDRNEEWDDSAENAYKSEQSGQNNFSNHSTSHNNDTTSRAAYNSTGMSQDTAGENSGTVENGGGSGGSSKTAGSDNRKTNHKGHLYGNIGVTKTQEMIEDELNLRLQSIYDIITRAFIERFCIMVY